MTFTPAIERLNLWSDHLIPLVWPLFWQSSVLILGMFLLDVFLRRKFRPSVRHALWVVVVVKLLLPPSIAFPTGIGWWLRPREAAPAKQPAVSYVVTYGPATTITPVSTVSPTVVLAPHIRLSTTASALAAAGAISLALLIIMLMRWVRLHKRLGKLQPAPVWIGDILRDLRRRVQPRRPIRLMLTDASISPALCGLFRPVIVLPTALVERLTPSQSRAVLLHELFHLRNGDVWINCFQSLLQVVFWWHPLLWLANARIRRIREEVVDDAVRLALGEEAESYAPTLLEVARLSLARPLATLGLVGILESRQALRQRIERMVNFPPPKRAGLTIGSIIGILAFTSVAVPMGQAPPRNVKAKLQKLALNDSSDKSTQDQGRSPGLTSLPVEGAGQAEGSPLSYSFDPGFFRYFGSNGVDTLYDSLAGVARSPNVTKPVWDMQPLRESSRLMFDFHSGEISATDGAKLTLGDTSLSADSITLNRETGEMVAEGSVQLRREAKELESPKLSMNVTNMRLAQLQPSAPTPTRIYTSKARSAIFNKLQTIRLNNVTFDNLPLSEVVNYLRDEAKKRDPEGKGINFLLYPFTDTARSPGAIDPATGLPLATAVAEPVDINSVTIKIVPPLNDVRMIDVLDAITKVADKRIKYTLEDYGIAFRLSGSESAVPLFSRTIKIDPNTFAQGLESVVGVSVGNFQTGGQGGGGQQGSGGGITIPRVQIAPNGVGGGAQGGQGGGGQGGSGGGISGVTRPTAAISPDAVRQFIAGLGVDLTPPKSLFYTYGEGALLIHATKADIDTIEKAISAFPAGPAPSSGGSKMEMPTNPIPARTNEAKLPVLGDLPVVGRVFTRTVEVASAGSPAVPAEKNNDKLLTRIFKVNPHTFIEAVRTAVALPDHPSAPDTINAFRKMLLDSGVELVPPKNLFYNEHGATLLVRATAQEMEVIEKFIQAFNVQPPQVVIQVKFVEVSEEDAKVIGLTEIRDQTSPNTTYLRPINRDDETNGNTAAILPDSQFRELLHALKQRNGADSITEQSVTTLSGRQAQVQNAEVQSVVKLNPEALVSPGVASSNTFITERLYLGPLLDIVPFVEDAGDKILLTISAKVTEFVGYDPPPRGETVPIYVDGKATTIKPPHCRTHVRSFPTSTFRVQDGQTIVLGKPKVEMVTYAQNGKAVSTPSTSTKNLFVFVTATLIDAAGNPIHASTSPASR